MAVINERYKRGKIYTIRCRYDHSLIYVGSTIDTLAKRIGGHRIAKDSHSTSLSNIVNGDWNNWYIELYEEYPCDNKSQLEKREGQVIREIATINKCIAGRTRKEYREDNHDKILEKAKEYREDNRDKLLEKAKEYRQNNRDEILEKKKEKVKCEICGCQLTKHNLKRHQQTKKCLDYNLNNK